MKPVLDYGCSVWDPYRKNQVDRIEKVQKNAARYVTNDYSFTSGKTNAHMTALRWLPHKETRARTRVTTLYKGLNGFLEIPTNQYQIKSDKRQTRQSGYQMFHVPPSNVDSHLYSFFPNTFRLWNNLPNSIKLINNTESFKDALQYITLTKSP